MLFGTNINPVFDKSGIRSRICHKPSSHAAIDLVYAMPDSGSLRRRIERQNGLYTLDVGAQNGLGSRNYRLFVLGE